MSVSTPIYLHIFWHQHQPWYVAPGSNKTVMPWVRLHGIKDYYDMAWLSKEFDGWKQTINLAPSLLTQIQGHVDGSIVDPLFELSRKPADALTEEEKKRVLQRFFDAHAPRMIHPFPRYDELFRKRGGSIDRAMSRFTTQDIRDLQVWFNLVWIDPIWRENPNYPLLELIKKQRDFSETDKITVLDFQIEILKQIIPLHKDLHRQNKILLTCSPFYHPILPLLCDNSIAKVSNPHDPIPEPHFVHPEDAEWHIREGLNCFESIMGFRPTGMWPSEGSVSDEACALIAKAGIDFFATDEGILFRSTMIDHSKNSSRDELFRLHRLSTKHGEIDCVFRDHGLSDLIGFVYKDRDPKEAAKDFISHLKTIATGWTDPTPPLVSVILDGENCWEFYPRDGHDFLKFLIEGILKDPQVHPSTLPEYRERYPAQPTIRSIFPGSWINSNFRIWIGHQEDNAAWHYLRQARETLAQCEAELDNETKQKAWELLHISEGSDWFWWYGDENASAHELLFDSLFREHLIHLYETIGKPTPETLKRPIKQETKVVEAGGILFQQPVLSGRYEGYYEWVGTRTVLASSGGGAMHQAGGEVQAKIRYGRLNKFLAFFVEITNGIQLNDETKIYIHVTKPFIRTLELQREHEADYKIESNRVLEGIINLESLGIQPHQEVWFFFSFESKGKPEFSIPHGNELYLQPYTATTASLYWYL